MRAVTLQDADALAELDMELFPDNCFNERTLAKEIAAGGGLAIYEGELLVGYLLARWDDDVMDITRIGVRETSQGEGLGTRMLLDALECSTLDVMLCVGKHNQGAIQFYKRHGFEVTGMLLKSWVMFRATSS